MRARLLGALCAVLTATVGYAGCRAVDGLGDLSFDGGDDDAEDASDALASDDAGDSACPTANQDCDARAP